jgi:regulator of protease activity HflC (stomatin/prohibitin superfamily)
MEERELELPSGWPILGFLTLALAGLIGLVVLASAFHSWPLGVSAGVLFLGWLVLTGGFVINNPNQARVVQLFGRYVGTLKDVGFFYGNPFYTMTKVSLRVQTFETGTARPVEVRNAAGHVIEAKAGSRRPSKVNDRDGTPIEIAAVVVWRVVNAAEAVFQVDDYEDYIEIQSDAALRTLASRHPYDGHGEARSLRANTIEVGDELKHELQERMQVAGVEVIEARISFLAYAQEIAAAMLQRQQAGAYIAARQLIVEAAVGMVESALQRLTADKLVDFDPERRAAMVSNMMVVLCGHGSPQPVLNVGTLYQ